MKYVGLLYKGIWGVIRKVVSMRLKSIAVLLMCLLAQKNASAYNASGPLRFGIVGSSKDNDPASWEDIFNLAAENFTNRSATLTYLADSAAVYRAFDNSSMDFVLMGPALLNCFTGQVHR